MPSLPDEVDFNFHIKPILSNRCFACHGPDKSKVQSGLQLSDPERAFINLAEDGEPNRFALVPHDPEASELYRRVTSRNPDVRMPPPGSKKKQLNEYDPITMDDYYSMMSFFNSIDQEKGLEVQDEYVAFAYRPYVEVWQPDERKVFDQNERLLKEIKAKTEWDETFAAAFKERESGKALTWMPLLAAGEPLPSKSRIRSPSRRCGTYALPINRASLNASRIRIRFGR